MTVSPEILKQVKGIELRTRGLVGSLFAGEYRSVFRGQGMEFAEVRAYEQGDDFRTIDWNVSARLASPYVKTVTEERELTLLLLVDQSGSTRFGEPVTKASLAVEVAAVLALAAAHQNDRVGALLFADEVERVIPPRKGRRHALRVIRDLVAFEPCSTIGVSSWCFPTSSPRAGSDRCGGSPPGMRSSRSRLTILASTPSPNRVGSR
jgi:uncharacterized protein (DUF58 family)